MRDSTPLYLLATGSRSDIEGGRWQFILRRTDGRVEIAESDFERALLGDRVALLAVVRGLEALPEPSQVLLLTPSRYILNGFRHGLCTWEDQGWQQRRLGRRMAIRNHDLWARVAQARQFHQVTVRYSESSLNDAARIQNWAEPGSLAEDLQLTLAEAQQHFDPVAPPSPLAHCA